MTDPHASDPLAMVQIDPGTLRGVEGFYRVGRSTAGRWWLLRPDGRPMVYKGCNAVLRQQMGKAGANRYFQWAEQVYGDDHRRFLDDCVATLREAGFNGFGGWSFLFTPTTGHRDQGLPFVEILAAREVVGIERMILQPAGPNTRPDNIIGGWTGSCNIDAFDPACWDLIDRHCRERLPELAGNRNLLGYFCDNECMYGQPHVDRAWTGRLSDLEKPPDGPTLLQRYLAQPEGKPGGDFAWRWALERHGGRIDRLAGDWGIAIADAAGMRELTDVRRQVLVNDAYSADHAAFTRRYVREYHERMHQAIRRYDPVHLIMTSRCPAPPGQLVLEAIRGCFEDGLVDVQAMNCYRAEFRDRVEQFHRWGRMPIINGEFNWCSGHFLDWGRYLREEPFSGKEMEQIALRGRMALEQAFTHPALIGYTWFKWYSGREFTSDDYGLAVDQPFGAVVSNRGEKNIFNLPLLRDIHARLEGIATGRVEALSGAETGPVPQTLGMAKRKDGG